MRNEPEIFINGVLISASCAMTLRVAIESFASSLIDDGLGDNEEGLSYVKVYLQRIDEIRGHFFNENNIN